MARRVSVRAAKRAVVSVTPQTAKLLDRIAEALNITRNQAAILSAMAFFTYRAEK